MSRPWVSKRIDELEHLFKFASDDPITLHALENELARRQTQRAVKLLVAVRERLKMPDIAGRRVQESLFGPESTPSNTRTKVAAADGQVPYDRRTQSRTAQGSATPPPRNRVTSGELIAFPPSVSSSPKSSNLVMPVEEACRILNVTLSADWERIELSRRSIVQKSHPDRLVSCTPQQRQALVRDAYRANEAARVLSYSRIEMNASGNQSAPSIGPSSETSPLDSARATS